MIVQAEREALMVAQYGEVCSRQMAARIMSKAPATIAAMLKDGRLDLACGGTMVDVRSIAAYIAAPAEKDFEAKKLRRGEEYRV